MSGNRETDDVLRAALRRYRVEDGRELDMAAHAPDDLPKGIPDKRHAKALLSDGVKRLKGLQELLYANKSWSLLVILQAMDAAGKDSTIKHVMSGVNPQGVAVTSFKAPGSEDLAHGFLWRISRALPARGMIGIFNRSHYEDVIVARVHPALVVESGLPEALATRATLFQDRIADIAAFEAYLARQGTRVIKIFLNVSPGEQRERLLSRLDTPSKTWKFDPGDLVERDRWTDYQRAYRAAIAGTATAEAPWYIVPADRKWYARLVVAEAIVQALEGLDLGPPRVDQDGRAALAEARARLEAEPA